MRARVVLALIVIAYVILATGYAVGTPRWQNPDEPAHYNYIRHLAEGRGLPVLQMGDYDAAYLERLKAARFPANMPIDNIRYEGYQPPLYYALAVPVYWATAGLGLDAQVLALRLFSVALGVLLLLAAYAVARLALDSPPLVGEGPGERFIALGAAAFVAFLPMHTAMTAAINNDTLAELVLSAILGLLLLRLRDRIAPRRYVLLTGVLLALAFLTKVSIYQAAALVPFVELVRWVRGPRDTRSAVAVAGAILLIAVLVAAPWFARNALVYGPTDLIGKARHDAVVAGQITTAEFVAQHGWVQLAQDFLVTSFRSFWGQFGWMGIVLDGRIYLGLLALSLAAGVGLIAFAMREARRLDASLALLALTFVLALVLYLGYNVTLLQHQGRYLFPAVVPLGVFFALGLREVWRRRTALVVAGALAAILVVRFATGWLSGGSGLFDAMLWGGGAGLLAIWGLRGRERWASWPYAACFVALVLVDVWCLVGFVIPYFRP